MRQVEIPNSARTYSSRRVEKLNGNNLLKLNLCLTVVVWNQSDY